MPCVELFKMSEREFPFGEELFTATVLHLSTAPQYNIVILVMNFKRTQLIATKASLSTKQIFNQINFIYHFQFLLELKWTWFANVNNISISKFSQFIMNQKFSRWRTYCRFFWSNSSRIDMYKTSLTSTVFRWYIIQKNLICETLMKI